MAHTSNPVLIRLSEAGGPTLRPVGYPNTLCQKKKKGGGGEAVFLSPEQLYINEQST